MANVDCSQSPVFFLKIVRIEGLPVRAAMAGVGVTILRKKGGL